MQSRVQSFILQGIDATSCEVEVDINERGIRSETLVGLPDTAVKESLERVKTAISNAGYRVPNAAMVVNLAPADVRKEGPVYDLPIAVGILIADGVVQQRAVGVGAGGGGDDGVADGLDPRRYLFAGELALDGRVRPVKGVIAMAALARDMGMAGVIVPDENAIEAAVVEGIEAIGIKTLTELVGVMNGLIEARPHPPVNVGDLIERSPAEVDFGEVRGQEAVKRAITICAAGGHNLLMLGPAGTGKTMMAKALPGVLPPMSPREALNVTRIYSAVGRLPRSENGSSGGLITRRPVRSPHHTASAIAVIGGGAIPKPGEISLAHHGVLFLDELPEFPRAVLDTLRQPLEDGCVTIARAHSAVTFPARFMLVAAMNPTAKGDMPTDERGYREMERYVGRISRPLIDRIDVHVEAPAVPWKELSGKPKGTTSAQMREQVVEARANQLRRQGVTLNCALRGSELDELATMSEEATTLIGQAINELGLSARAYDKIRRVARTIADLEGAEALTVGHVAEAVQYRLLDRRV